MTLGLALIVKDEQHNLPRLLASVEGAFDQVVLVDTGSTDHTVAVFEDWCDRTGQPHVIGSFEWCENFAAARNYAQSLLTTEWVAWADGDDEIVNARALRFLAAAAPPDLAAWAFDYRVDSYPSLGMARKRLVRSGAGTWTGRIHERQLIEGDVEFGPEAVEWVHHGVELTQANLNRCRARAERIMRRWNRDEPDNKLVSDAVQALEAGRFDEGSRAMYRALAAERDRVAVGLRDPVWTLGSD